MDWDEMARPWLESADALEKTHAPVIAALIAAANLKIGEKALDVGSGTGPSIIAAGQVIGPSGRITGVDIAPPLLARAAELVPDNVELIVADAGSHSFAGANFDVIIANFGIMFFADTEAAFANLRTAVRPGGRFAATVWGPPLRNPWFAAPRAILEQIIPDLPRPDPAAPGPMRFGDPTQLGTMLKASGWAPKIETLDLQLSPPGNAAEVAALHMKMTVGMMLRGVDVSSADLAAIEKALVATSAAQEIDGDIKVPAQIHVITATAA